MSPCSSGRLLVARDEFGEGVGPNTDIARPPFRLSTENRAVDKSRVFIDRPAEVSPWRPVQYLLGHSDARMTDLYNRTNKDASRNVVDRIAI
jgi:hypothetical protein